ncbi:hypothetical protein ACTG2S_01935 [Aeromonas sp. 82P]|uniref:hypothetical protein n=1 Tax=Aeromonas TaxID=642 RepID=UPI0023638C02|nr:hypothetical protein [Aeromonas veronii]MDD1846044.1 hypothetical protein [Aeromonas veronii]
MGNPERLAMMKNCSIENKNLPIRIESVDALKLAISLTFNRSDKHIKSVLIFNNENPNTLFNSLTHSDVERNIVDFLSEKDAKISIITNEKERVKSSTIYHKENKSKIEILSINQKMISTLEEGKPHKIKSLLLGDNETLIVGDFTSPDFTESLYVNFFDVNSSELLNNYFNGLKDFILNGGEFKK